MTRSPLTSTTLALLPLAALAWPLIEVVKPVEVTRDPLVEPAIVGTAKRADITLRTAHPYSSVEVTIGNSVCKFSAEEDYKEILFTIPESGKITMKVSAVWPKDIPETALLISLEPDHLLSRSFTLWGTIEATQEFNCRWNLSK